MGVRNRLSRRGRQTLLVLHYVTSVGWLGGGFAQLTLNLTALATGDTALRHAAHEIAHELWGNVAVTQAYLTLSEVLGHLDILLADGRASEQERDGVVRFAAA